MTVLALAAFPHESAYLRGRHEVVTHEYRLVGEWLPYGSEALGPGPGARGIRAAAIVSGVLGAVGLFALTVWSMAFAYPFNSGGRPLFSWPAYIPAAVEFGAFTAAVGGLIWFFREGRLTRLHDAAFEFAEVARASQDRFVLAVACDGGEDANTVLAILANAGADHTRLVTP
ncbi:quinol:electron acceptor oxidoreductase subunit ActD [Novosphingobium panipatense]|uniref:Quinol:cytochrome c oxidoreductase membrane protein n=1 Tax=Novosphingobium panipatense TaxID=428991 RepID=A0ABY1QPI1_9SPHN|nr:quinol:electron acceptor oxidoreductase subunit ActD [Novosphingobium panipatense]SMP75488.1 quinol:cytochrome c oxidoreductase membrane protein [Novosphingobium panipatense]